MRVRDLRVALGLDWGSASPGCVLFGAALPDNHAHIFDEIKFQRMTVRDVAAQIVERCEDWKLERVPTVFCDPALKAKTGQIGEDYIQTFARYGVTLVPVSNHREAGWQRVHEALAVDPATGTPWLTAHPRCKYLIRTIPMMVQAKHNPEDMDTDGDDHPCLVAGTRVATARGDVPIEQVTLADQVWTPDGLRAVFAVALTHSDAETWTVSLDDGRVLAGTGNHPIIGAMGQRISLDSLRYGDIIHTWPISHGVIAMRGRSGVGVWGRSRSALTFITEMAIRATTPSVIWNACRRWSTRLGTSGEAARSIWRRFDPWRLPGIVPMLAVSGMRGMDARHGRVESRLTSPAMSAGASSLTSRDVATRGSAPITASRSGGATQGWTWLTGCVPSAAASSVSTNTTTNGKPVHGVAVVACNPRRSGRAPVYNLTVDGGLFYANGILTHNCDTARYLLMGGLRGGTVARTVAHDPPANSWAWWRRFHARQAEPQGVLA